MAQQAGTVGCLADSSNPRWSQGEPSRRPPAVAGSWPNNDHDRRRRRRRRGCHIGRRRQCGSRSTGCRGSGHGACGHGGGGCRCRSRRGGDHADAAGGSATVYHYSEFSSSAAPKEHRDPFELVAGDISLVADRLRSMVVSEVHLQVPKLASATEYFFKVGAEGKKFRPMILLLMQSALKFPLSESTEGRVISMLTDKLRTPHLNIAEITEMIHVASLIHDDVLDDADTRRGVSSLNLVMGNKVSVLAGDFLLSRACAALAGLGNYEVASLMTTALEDIVTGEIMQNFPTREQQRSMEYYLQKNYYKTASLISNSCKSVAILAGHTAEVSMLAYEYGRNLGLAFQLIDDVLDFTGTSASLGKGSLSDIRHGIITAPILYAMEEFPQLHEVVDSGFEDPANVELALDYLQKSRGIERAKELAREHANRAIRAIEALPDSDDEDVLTSRRALIDMTERVVTRTK